MDYIVSAEVYVVAFSEITPNRKLFFRTCVERTVCDEYTKNLMTCVISGDEANKFHQYLSSFGLVKLHPPLTIPKREMEHDYGREYSLASPPVKLSGTIKVLNVDRDFVISRVQEESIPIQITTPMAIIDVETISYA